MASRLDHIVIGAAELEEAVRWATAAFGVAPAARGRHPLMGTHNALWHMSVPGREDAYLEIIAIEPGAPQPAQPRWFGLDQQATQVRLMAGPQLLTWQVRPEGGLDATVAQLDAAGVAPGAPMALTRDRLSWRLTVPEDGVMPFEGRFPVLIEWDAGVPTPPETLPPMGIALEALEVRGSDQALVKALMLAGAHGLATLVPEEAPVLRATLSTPAGRVVI
ncbi:MAG: VOC family protein [Pseudomonadota bacterium]